MDDMMDKTTRHEKPETNITAESNLNNTLEEPFDILKTSYFPTSQRSELGDGNKIFQGDLPIVTDSSDLGNSPSVLAQADEQTMRETPLTGKQALDIVKAQRSGTVPAQADEQTMRETPLTGKQALDLVKAQRSGTVPAQADEQTMRETPLKGKEALKFLANLRTSSKES